jgi:hypothetical protein
VLFSVGLLVALFRWREPRYGFLLIWLVGALMPSILTSHAPPDVLSDAPSSIRDILGLLVVFVFPAVALVEVGRWVERRVLDRSLTRAPYLLAVPVLILCSCLFLTVRDYFFRWAGRQDVQYFYQTDLTAVGQRIDEMMPGASVAVAGLSPDFLDRPTLDFSTRVGTEAIRLCDPRQTLVLPDGPDPQILVPDIVPFDDEKHLEARLETWTQVEVSPAFTSYHLRDRGTIGRHLRQLETSVTLPDGTRVAVPISFSGHLAFLGYEWTEGPPDLEGPVSLLTYWRVETPPDDPLKIFVHLLDPGQSLIAQHDGLASPPQGWATGDLIVQKHTFSLPTNLPSDQYSLRTGIYHASDDGERLKALTADSLLLYSLEIR